MSLIGGMLTIDERDDGSFPLSRSVTIEKFPRPFFQHPRLMPDGNTKSPDGVRFRLGTNLTPFENPSKVPCHSVYVRPTPARANNFSGHSQGKRLPFVVPDDGA